ncbi:MAG: flagellar FliJ family protein [Bdellovibrionota bacterium]|nr:flagellar FliJ family protein [Bdellovibrionota bacterium]
MKKFKFKYESVLKLRASKEDKAKRDYAEALERETSAKKEKQSCIENVKKYREYIAVLEKSGQIHEIINILEIIRGTESKIHYKEQEILGLAHITKQKHHVYMELYKDRKALEKLKEKQSEAYTKDAKKKQTRKIEDMVLSRFGRGDKF